MNFRKTLTFLYAGIILFTAGCAVNEKHPQYVAYTYDEFNRQAGMTQTESGTTFTTSNMTYNAAGQPLTQTVNGRTTSIVYNVVNRTRTITLPGDRTVTEVYHPSGELQRVSGADTYTQEWTYDPVWGQKATLTTYKDSDTPQVTTWIYNNRGKLASKKYPNNNGPSYTYNADGNLLTRTWERNITTSYTYDNAGRLLTQSYSDNTPGITATYDYLDRIVSLTDASGTRNFTYNAQHQLVNETIPHIMNLRSSFTYDNFGRRTSRTLQHDNNNIASAGRSYDTFGRIASVSNGTDTLSYAYRPGGQLSLSGWRNAQNDAMSNQSYEYDQYNRLTGIKLNNVNEVSYTLNAKDQRTAATYANAGLWNFTYDDKGQVTGANGSSKSYTYSYDGIGNRLTANENSAVTNYTSNLLNQYTLINNAVPNYDADGNMTSSGNGWAYTYNGENRITQATKGSTSVTMAYDYAGRRISKTVSASGGVQNSYKYVYDGFKLIAVYNSNDLVMTFTWQPESLGMDVPVSMTYGGATYYYVTDGNKNVTALLDASGNRVAEYVYGPFGQTVSATGSMAQINPFRFSSEFHDDETGLVYYNYRYYSPELGRWTKRDPIEEDGGSNLYGFVNNSATSYIDNYGLWSSLWFWPFNDHEQITKEALARIKNELKLSSRVINEIVEGNNDTDSGEYFYNLYYHFNRNMTESSSNAKFEYWVLLQKTKIEIILMLRKIKNPHPMTPEIENICSCALNKMGILSHMGQDFYAHAVSYDTSTNDFDSSVFSSMSQSIINGEFMLSMNLMSTQIHNVIIGSNPGTIPTFSSPDIPFFVKPSNYNGSWKSSEHGQIWTVEPGNRAADRKQRRQRAINWTYSTLKPLLMTWIEKCPCYEYGVLDYILPWRWL